MNQYSFEVTTGGRLKSVEDTDRGWLLHIEPFENEVEVHVKRRNGNGNGLLKSEAVKVYRRVTGKYPNVVQIDDINNEGIDDLERWERVIREYMGNGGWMGRVRSMRDIYSGRKAPLGTPKKKEPEKVVDPLSSFYRR